ncbi:MAG: 3',5'-cyclic nucleotide phosphodiesterase [SAR324 cluster bacterium]
MNPLRATAPIERASSGPARSSGSPNRAAAREELVAQVQGLLNSDGLAGRVGAHGERLARFVDEASRMYRENPYHNWAHAVEVTHCAAWLVSRRRLAELPPVDKFWLLISAIAHDLDHPGHNNQWEIATGTLLAQRYAGSAVLERHSLALARELIARPECDFSATMPQAHRLRGQVLLSELIVATDFTAHKSFVEEFQRFLQSSAEAIDLGDPAASLPILKALIKAADISNVTLDFPEARQWAERVMQEMWAQGRREKALGLPVGPLNDAERMTLEQAQIGFILFVALELFVPLTAIEPEAAEMVGSLKQNLVLYRYASPT